MEDTKQQKEEGCAVDCGSKKGVFRNICSTCAYSGNEAASSGLIFRCAEVFPFPVAERAHMVVGVGQGINSPCTNEGDQGEGDGEDNPQHHVLVLRGG